MGYSRDHRGDCVQVIIALVIITPEVLPGNTIDNQTLGDFLERIEQPDMSPSDQFLECAHC